MVRMGSPSKDKDALQHSNKLLHSVNKNPVLHNHVRGADPSYDQMWEDAVNGRTNFSKPREEERRADDSRTFASKPREEERRHDDSRAFAYKPREDERRPDDSRSFASRAMEESRRPKESHQRQPSF